ncbi:PH domain-containing protein [Solimonas sp. SE-A11]|uniref:PH domain-containing protein n=1 Tax=Solimonas sp. SE-A11 TaxID=3054954 RepID=UPI00259D28AD|nr:PH domain-containing protein [Solimonas sp. SE-A11]MDM4768989.1 PH domain-containing protein [Solimonas sp. SE-A11]
MDPYNRTAAAIPQPAPTMSAALRIQPWRRVLLGLACLMPMLLMFSALLGYRAEHDESPVLAVSSGVAFILFLGWLFVHVYRLGSVVVDAEGLSHASLRLGMPRRQRLRWDQVQRVRYTDSAYRFSGADGREVILSAALLPDTQVTLHALRLFMPTRLLAQLGLRAH